MSWISSLFATPKSQPPVATQLPVPEKRVLEETHTPSTSLPQAQANTPPPAQSGSATTWYKSLFWASRPDTPPSSSSQPAPAPHRILQEPTSKPQPQPPAPQAPVRAPAPQIRDRSNRPLIILGAGTLFFAFSLVITRRAFLRRRLASKAAFWTNAPDHIAQHSKQINGTLEALEALNLATINVFSLALMGSGAALWYLDVNSLGELRQRLRVGNVEDGGEGGETAEGAFQDWLDGEDGKVKRKIAEAGEKSGAA